MDCGKSLSACELTRRDIPPDRVRLVRDGASGVEAIHARFTGHAYDLHRHDDWLVGVTKSGVQDFFCRGTRHRSTPGRVILIEPQEAHDGQAGNPDGFSYCMLYLPRAWLKAGIAGRTGDNSGEDDPGFPASLADDPLLARAIRQACGVLARPSGRRPPDDDPAIVSVSNSRLQNVSPPDVVVPDRLLVEAALDSVVGLLCRHLDRNIRRIKPENARGHNRLVARRARERLHDAMADNIGTDALARAAGAADRFHLTRAFRAVYGTSPHSYLVQIRLLSARHLLAYGETPAAVAAACGFADQSHFGRWFRRAYGVTPAAYRACCTDVPDRAAMIG